MRAMCMSLIDNHCASTSMSQGRQWLWWCAQFHQLETTTTSLTGSFKQMDSFVSRYTKCFTGCDCQSSTSGQRKGTGTNLRIEATLLKRWNRLELWRYQQEQWSMWTKQTWPRKRLTRCTGPWYQRTQLECSMTITSASTWTWMWMAPTTHLWKVSL